MSSTVVKTVGSAIAGVLSALAVANTYPALTPVFSAAAGLLAGWLHIPAPGQKAAQ